MADHQSFDHHTHGSGDKGTGQDGERQRQTATRGAGGNISPTHNEFAMREVDDTHHAKDHRQPGAGNHQKGEGVSELIEHGKDALEQGHPLGLLLWEYKGMRGRGTHPACQVSQSLRGGR